VCLANIASGRKSLTLASPLGTLPSIVGIATDYVDAGAVARGVLEDHLSSRQRNRKAEHFVGPRRVCLRGDRTPAGILANNSIFARSVIMVRRFVQSK
jgi:hypothetical protein